MKKYEKSRADIKKAQTLGYPVDPEFLEISSVVPGDRIRKE